MHCPAPVEIPIDWPTFPDPTGRVALSGDTVTMSLGYWLEVTRYVIAVNRVQQVVGDTR